MSKESTATMLAKRSKTDSQIEFSDPVVGTSYKSLYLDTLGAEAVRRSITAISASASNSSNQHDAAPEGYVHGTLSTAGIAGAEPAVYSLTKQAARAKAWKGQHQGTPAADGPDVQVAGPAPTAASSGSYPAAAAAAAAAAAESQDPGMRPRQRHPTVVRNKPDYSHSTADIDGAQPLPKDIPKNPRGTDPLNPRYQVPSSSLPLPSGPQPPDKFLQDSLNVADIPGATRRPVPISSSRPGQLDVSDIEGSNPTWRPHHRQHFGEKLRDAGLDVADINTYMARYKPQPRSPTGKGHPEGPRVQPHVKPRLNPADMDNSLRTLDIEGTRAVLLSQRVAARQPHDHATSVADIEGAAPADRDKVRLFERKKVAAAAAIAEQEAAQAVMSGLELAPQDLTALWRNCSKLDKDSSGFLTASELEKAMQRANLALSAADTQQLLAALKDNAGLLNYITLTKQLKGRVSRPGSAKPQHQSQVLQAPEQQMQPQVMLQLQGSKQQVRFEDANGVANGAHDATGIDEEPNAAECISLYTTDTKPPIAAAGAHEAACNRGEQSDTKSSMQQQQQQQQAELAESSRPSGSQVASSACHVRPSSAPARCSRTHGQGSSSSGSIGTSGSSFKSVSHWFGGSSRDKTAAEENTRWRPGHTVIQSFSAGASKVHQCGSVLGEGGMFMSAGCSGGGGGSSSSRHVHGARQAGQQQQQQQQQQHQQARDVVPGWVIGADALHGTYKVYQPFQGTAAVQGSSDNQGGSSRSSGRAAVRPASAGPVCGRSSGRNSAAVAGGSTEQWGWGGMSAGHMPTGDNSSVQRFCGCDDMALLQQRKQQQPGQGVQQKQRPRSASALRRPPSAQPVMQQQKHGQCSTSSSIAALNALNAYACTTGSTASSSGVTSGSTAAIGNAVAHTWAAAEPALGAKMQTANAAAVANAALVSGTQAGARVYYGAAAAAASNTSGGPGLAERRRLMEGMQQDLEAVRMLQ